jgi:hypothetical protein
MRGRGGWAALIEQAGAVGEISGSAHGTTHNRIGKGREARRAAAFEFQRSSLIRALGRSRVMEAAGIEPVQDFNR